MDSATKASGGGIQLGKPYDPLYFLGLPSGSSSSQNDEELTNRVIVNQSNGPTPSFDRKPTSSAKLPTPPGSLSNDYDEAAASLINPILYKPPHPSKIRPPSQFKRSVGRPRKCYSGNSAALRRQQQQQQDALASEDATIAGSLLLSSDVTLRPPILNPPNLTNTLANQIASRFANPNGNEQRTARTYMIWPNMNPALPKFAGAANFTRYENGTPQVQTVGAGIQNPIININPQLAPNAQPQHSEHVSLLAPPAHMAHRTLPTVNMPPRTSTATIAPNASTYVTKQQAPDLSNQNVFNLCLQIVQAIPQLKVDEIMDQLLNGTPNQLKLTIPPGLDLLAVQNTINDLIARAGQNYQRQIPPPQRQVPSHQRQIGPPQPQLYNWAGYVPPSTQTSIAPGLTNGSTQAPPKRSEDLIQDDIVRQDLETGAGDDEEFHEVETYSDYVPSKVNIGQPHPDPVVETSSLATVEPPDITYSLKLPSKIIDQALLSSLQLESVIYASQQHLEKMPDNKRRGFLIGDGAGVGKGRTIAGIIYENYLNNRKKSIWLSVSTDLKLDAERDLKDIGAKIPVFLLGKFQYGRRINEDHGVIFTTYSGLVSKSHSVKGQYGSRMGQLVSWAGNNFDGVIVFDECHKAKNISMEGKGAKKLSKAAEFVQDLQNKLPYARIVYASATGASETRHLGYMTRLGLWGPGTYYPSFPMFCDKIRTKGVGAMELIATELKMRGSYLARQLSFKTTSFSIQEAPLSDDVINLYDSCVDMWMVAFRHFREAEIYCSHDKKIRRTLWSSFWAAHQKFFKYLCISIKVPMVVEIAKKAIEDGKCVVIGLQSTGEAKTLEALEEGDVNEFISTARATFESLIENHFPAPKKPRKWRRASTSTDSDINPLASLASEQSTSSSSCIDENWARDPCRFFIKDGITLPVINETNAKQGPTTRLSRSGVMTAQERKQQALKELIEAKKKDTKSARALRHKRRLATNSKSRIKKPALDSDTELSNPTTTSSSSSHILSDDDDDDDDDFIVDDSTSETVSESDGSDEEIKVVGIKSASKQKKPSRKFINDDSDDEPQMIAEKKGVPVFTVSSEDEATDLNEEDDEQAETKYDPMVQYGERLMKMQDELYARIDELGPKLPNNTLDDLIYRLGGPEEVAEMTGRKGRLVKDSDGQVTYRARNEVDASEILNIEEKKRFMDGKKLIAIISEAASSGISLQADRRVKNQRRRVHITIELPWSADRAIQQFGRTHRSNQVTGPEYIFVISKLCGEKRFASAVAKRLESLGALTHGDRRATTDQRDLSQYSLDSKYSRKALEHLNQLLEHNSHFSDVVPQYEGDFIKDTRDAYVGVGLGKQGFGGFTADPMSLNINMFLNRILGMKVLVQNAVFDLFDRYVNRLILRKKVSGEHESGILELTSESGKAIAEAAEVMTIRTAVGGITCRLRNVRVERGISWEKAMELYEPHKISDRRSGFYISTNSNTRAKLVILAIRDGIDMFRIYKPNVGRQAKLEHYSTITDKFNQVKLDKAEKQWVDIYEETYTKCVHLYYFGHCKRIENKKDCDVGMRHRKFCIMSGAVMTIWPWLEDVKRVKALEKVQIIRLRLDDSREIGPKIPQDSVEKVRSALREAQMYGIKF